LTFYGSNHAKDDDDEGRKMPLDTIYPTSEAQKAREAAKIS
jgi:hypothetical protein